MRIRAEGTHKPRALRVGDVLHDHGPTGPANAKQNLRRRSELGPNLDYRLGYRLCSRLQQPASQRAAEPTSALAPFAASCAVLFAEMFWWLS